MTEKELESFLKNTLKGYVDDYNRVNHKDRIDFNVSFTLHKFKATDVEGYDKKDEKFAKVKELDGQNLYYLRLARILVDKSEKRVIYTTYRPADKYKKQVAMRMMYLELLKQLVLGGLEYSEALYKMQEKEKEDQKEPVEEATK